MKKCVFWLKFKQKILPIVIVVKNYFKLKTFCCNLSLNFLL
jgi:hypothetical protein